MLAFSGTILQVPGHLASMSPTSPIDRFSNELSAKFAKVSHSSSFF
jgi:hypothetical protein